jgi:hypothetical protein
MEYSLIYYGSAWSTVRSGNPHPSIYHVSDYTFVNIISRDELNTCTRHVVGSRYKQITQPIVRSCKACQLSSNHLTQCTTNSKISVCQASVHILHEDLWKQWVPGGNPLKETTKCHLIAEYNCPTRTVANRCHVNFHKCYGSLSNAVHLTQVVCSYD